MLRCANCARTTSTYYQDVCTDDDFNTETSMHCLPVEDCPAESCTMPRIEHAMQQDAVLSKRLRKGEAVDVSCEVGFAPAGKRGSSGELSAPATEGLAAW